MKFLHSQTLIQTIKKGGSRSLCVILAVAMLLSMLVTSLAAVISVQQDNPNCPNHTEHTDECGYVSAVVAHPCGHVHTDNCYVKVLECTHEHTDECGENGESCTHEHTDECYRKVLSCAHEHDESCGYLEPVAGQPCQHQCAHCDPAGELTPDTVQFDLNGQGEKHTDASISFVKNSDTLESLAVPVLDENGQVKLDEQGKEQRQELQLLSDYLILNDGARILLKSEYLSGLSVGEHTLYAVFESGERKLTVTVTDSAAAETPQSSASDSSSDSGEPEEPVEEEPTEDEAGLVLGGISLLGGTLLGAEPKASSDRFSVDIKWSDTTATLKNYIYATNNYGANTGDTNPVANLTISTAAAEYAPGKMEIRIPYYLWNETDADGYNWLAGQMRQIAIPKAPNTSPTYPFYYTIDTKTKEIVITNWKTVEASSNFTIQVEYYTPATAVKVPTKFGAYDGQIGELTATATATDRGSGQQESLTTDTLTAGFYFTGASVSIGKRVNYLVNGTSKHPNQTTLESGYSWSGEEKAEKSTTSFGMDKSAWRSQWGTIPDDYDNYLWILHRISVNVVNTDKMSYTIEDEGGTGKTLYLAFEGSQDYTSTIKRMLPITNNKLSLTGVYNPVAESGSSNTASYYYYVLVRYDKPDASVTSKVLDNTAKVSVEETTGTPTSFTGETTGVTTWKPWTYTPANLALSGRKFLTEIMGKACFTSNYQATSFNSSFGGRETFFANIWDALKNQQDWTAQFTLGGETNLDALRVDTTNPDGSVTMTGRQVVLEDADLRASLSIAGLQATDASYTFNRATALTGDDYSIDSIILKANSNQQTVYDHTQENVTWTEAAELQIWVVDGTNTDYRLYQTYTSLITADTTLALPADTTKVKLVYPNIYGQIGMTGSTGIAKMQAPLLSE